MSTDEKTLRDALRMQAGRIQKMRALLLDVQACVHGRSRKPLCDLLDDIQKAIDSDGAAGLVVSAIDDAANARRYKWCGDILFGTDPVTTRMKWALLMRKVGDAPDHKPESLAAATDAAIEEWERRNV